MIRKEIVFISLLLSFGPVSVHANTACSINNFLKRIFGVLPAGVNKSVIAPNETCTKIWQAYRRNRAENLAVEIYDKNRRLIAASEIVSSGKSAQVDGDLAFSTLIKTPSPAHEKNSDLTSLTIRMIHNHPSGMDHSSGDIRVSLSYKALLETMGYEDASFSMDVMFSSNGVSSYTLGPDISLKNKSYSLKKSQRRELRNPAIAGGRDYYIKQARDQRNFYEDKLGVKTVEGPIPSEIDLVAAYSKKENAAMMLAYGSDKNALSNALVGTLDPKLKLIGGVIDFLGSPETQKLIADLESKDEALHLFITPNENADYLTLMETALDLRALLDHFKFKNNIVFAYKSEQNVIKQITLPYDFKIDGEKYVSEAIQSIISPPDEVTVH